MKKEQFPQLCGDLNETSWIYHFMVYTYPDDEFVIVTIDKNFYAVHKKDLAEEANWTSMVDPVPIEKLRDGFDPEMLRTINWFGVKHEFWHRLNDAFQSMGGIMCQFLVDSKFPLEGALKELVHDLKKVDAE